MPRNRVVVLLSRPFVSAAIHALQSGPHLGATDAAEIRSDSFTRFPIDSSLGRPPAFAEGILVLLLHQGFRIVAFWSSPAKFVSLKAAT